MPNWKEHLEVANRLGKSMNINGENLEIFLIANLIPDINNCYIVKEISKKISHHDTHFDGFDKPGYLSFLEKYKEKIKNNLAILGYFTHLYTDYIWNHDFYERINKDPEYSNWTHDELKIMKQKDFKEYNKLYMYNKLKISNIEECIKSISSINEISLTKEDILKVIEFINSQKESNIELKFYKKEELDKLMENSIMKIEKFLEKII